MKLKIALGCAALALALACGEAAPPADEPAAEPPTSGGAPGGAPGGEQPPPARADTTGGAPPDSLVIAGTRVGPVHAETSERDLIALLGPERVIRREAHIGEGFCAPGSVLYPGTPDEVEVLWTDTTYTEPATVRVSGAGSRWRTGAGVRVGTTLAELEQKAGEPIEFWGFGWDYGGSASWTDPGGQGEGTIALRLAPDPDSVEIVGREPRYTEVIGERQVRSDHPIVRRLDVRVERMSVILRTRRPEEHECRLP